MAPAPREQDYSTAPAALIFANIRRLALRDVRVTWDTAEKPHDRHAIYATRVDDLALFGFVGSPAGSTLAAIGLDGVRNGFVSQSRTGESTGAFIGLHDTAEKEVSLSGNDLRGVRPVTKGATYVHIQK
jgi:hypothetical protein